MPTCPHAHMPWKRGARIVLVVLCPPRPCAVVGRCARKALPRADGGKVARAFRANCELRVRTRSKQIEERQRQPARQPEPTGRPTHPHHTTTTAAATTTAITTITATTAASTTTATTTIAAAMHACTSERKTKNRFGVFDRFLRLYVREAASRSDLLDLVVKLLALRIRQE